ncbi:MAG TPA: hypothetical protein PKB02_13130 [Anaerohalosphaeraceae bacterium]|nr:hypothetical protein [Anaerohalosphaeraceae bacterium]
MADAAHKMQASLKKFNSEIRDFVKNKMPAEVVRVQKSLVLQALRSIVSMTPVDTGRARGNWLVTIGGPAVASIDALDKIGQDTINKGLAQIANLPPYQVVWISNNVDYIEFLEYGTESRPPIGMVATTVNNLRTMMRASLKEK